MVKAPSVEAKHDQAETALPQRPPPTKQARRRTIPLAEQVLPPQARLMAPEPVYPEIMPDEITRLTQAIGRILRRLQQEHGWTTAHLSTWLAQTFAGRRRCQIQDRELPALLERLQAYYQSVQGRGVVDATDLAAPVGRVASLKPRTPPSATI